MCAKIGIFLKNCVVAICSVTILSSVSMTAFASEAVWDENSEEWTQESADAGDIAEGGVVDVFEDSETYVPTEGSGSLVDPWKIELNKTVNNDSGESDLYYSFELPEKGYIQPYALVTGGNGTTWNSFAIYYDSVAESNRVFKADAIQKSQFVDLGRTGLISGKYIVYARMRDCTGFSLRINYEQSERYEEEIDSPSKPKLIKTDGGDYYGETSNNHGDTADYYYFTLSKKDNVSVYAKADWNYYLGVSIYGDPAYSSEIKGNSGDEVSFSTELGAGTYYIKITNGLSATTHQGYRFQVKAANDASAENADDASSDNTEVETNTVSATQLSKSITLTGVTDTNGKNLSLSVKYTGNVSYTGKKHIVSTGKATKKATPDLAIAVESDILSYAKVKYSYFNTKNATSDAYTAGFNVSLTAKKGASKAQKKSINKANKILKSLDSRCYFTISPYEIKGEGIDATVKLNKKKTGFKSVKVKIDNKTMTLKKGRDYTGKVESGKYKVTFQRNYSGTLPDNGISEAKRAIIKGVWTGVYHAHQGKTALSLVIENIDDEGNVSAVFNFSEHPDNKGVPTGSYTMSGSYDPETKTLYLYGVSWIVHPDGYGFVNINGDIDFNAKKITGTTDGYTGLEIYKN